MYKYIGHAEETMSIISKSLKLGAYICDLLPFRMSAILLPFHELTSCDDNSEMDPELGRIPTARRARKADDPGYGRHPVQPRESRIGAYLPS